MCGRGRIEPDSELGREIAGLVDGGYSNLDLRPTDPIPVRRLVVDGTEQLALLRWGLIPHDAVKPPTRNTFNARVETFHVSPLFKGAHRCLVMLDGFYEWSGPKGSRIQHVIRREDGRPLALAGLWDAWTSPDGEVIESATVLTTTSTDALANIHDRMPIALNEAVARGWLLPDVDGRALLGVNVPPSIVIEDGPGPRQLGMF